MNTKRIRQLAEQAGISWEDQAELGVWTAFDHELTQFAELIVKECADHIGEWRGRDLKQDFRVD